MIINLKQTEIELALRAYVVAQGISLHGKDLSISFTAGRRESGISAEISIDDVEIPGYTTSAVEEIDVPKAAVEEIDVPKAAVEEIDVPKAAVEAKPTVSLFG